MMIRSILLAAFAFQSITSSALAVHYRVYLLGGQSNGNGRGDASQLTAPLNTAQTDVRFYWHRTQSVSNVGHLIEDTWIDLNSGSGHGQTTPVYAREFGSELSFGRAMADAYPTANIAIIKYTEGGTNLYSQWSATGTQYTTFKTTVQTALAALTTAGDTYELGGMIWCQGESDTGGSNADNYQTNLTSLVNRVRQDVFAGANAPFVLSGLSDSQYGTTITTVGTGAYKVRQAQEAVATAMVQVGFVDTDGFPVRPSDTIHFNHTAQISLGQGFAAQMITLEANDPDNDGLSNDEEEILGTDPNLPDTDGDGDEDGSEVTAGTNPLSATSFFAVTDINIVGDEVTIAWPSKAGNLYNIQYSSDLSNWITVDANYPAGNLESSTDWTGNLVELYNLSSGGGTLALYDAQAGTDGNFNNAAFDSIDTDANTTATRLVQGGSLTGGGAPAWVLENAIFNSSSSGSPGFNFGGVNTADRASAIAAGDFFSFTIESGGSEVLYESLSFYTNQFSTNARIDVSYAIGAGSEVFVTQDLVPTTGNVAVTLKSIDFADFTASEDVTWSFYLYGTANANYGIRFDDITLIGEISSGSENETADKDFFRLELLP